MNAAAIVEFFRRTCFGAADDPDEFGDSLTSSGWRADLIQIQGESSRGDLMPSVWRLEHGELIFSSFRGRGGSRLVDCYLGLDAAVAPPLHVLRDAFFPLVRRHSPSQLSTTAAEVIWQWRERTGGEQVLTIGPINASPGSEPASARRGIAVHFAGSPSESRSQTAE